MYLIATFGRRGPIPFAANGAAGATCRVTVASYFCAAPGTADAAAPRHAAAVATDGNPATIDDRSSPCSANC